MAQRTLALALGALCLGVTTAQAEMKKISAAGYWEADAGTSDRGNPMCMVETHGTANDGSLIGMMIKYDTSAPDWFMYQFFKQDWNIPAKQSVRVALKVDNAPGRIFTGYQAGRADMVSFSIQQEAQDPQTREPQVSYLFNLLRGGQTLRISFPDGNEADWGAPLEGATAALSSMSQCIRYLAEQAQQKTQPYAPGNQSTTTQPYGTQQQLPPTQKTTQPYTPLSYRGA